MKPIKLIVAEHPLFKGLSARHVSLLAESGREEAYDAGHVLFREGEPADRFFLILEGTVLLESIEQDGENVPVQHLHAGEILGWSWLYQPFVWHFQARAQTPVHLAVFNGARLLIACERDHDFGYELMKRISQVLIQRLQATRRSFVERTGNATANI